MIKRLFISFVFILCAHSQAYAQCTSAIPGLPASPNLPCSNDYTPNPTPLNPTTDGPNDPASPNAIKHDRDACDADFMNQIHARSYLEANREVMIAGTLVKKPDSVLEYSCFDQSVRDTAVIAGPMFTESQFWLGSAGGVYSTISNPGSTYPTTITLNVYMGSLKQDLSLNRVVMDSLNNFVNTNNFTHEFLGGTAGVDDNVAANVAAAANTCDHMASIWDPIAKCENVNVTSFFRTFDDLVSQDPRDVGLTGLPQCGTNVLNATLIRVANNDPPAGATATAINRAGQYAFKDPVVTYVDRIVSTTCTAPIPTGVIVSQDKFNISNTGQVTVDTALTRTFPEYVCSNPGCYYHQPTDSGNLTFANTGTCRSTP